MFTTTGNFENNASSSSVKFIGVGKLVVTSIKASEELDDRNQRRITITAKPENKSIDGIVSKSFWLSMEPKVSNSGNAQMINAFGESFYGVSEYISQEGARQAFSGEAEFTAFLKVIYNFKKSEKFTFTEQAFRAIVERGDVSGFEKGSVTALVGRNFNGMVGIKDEKYTTLYPMIKFGWISDTSEDFTKALEKDKNSAYPNAKTGEVYLVQPFAVYDEKQVEASIAETKAEERTEDLPF